MERMFQVGQKVVCLRGGPVGKRFQYDPPELFPEAGKVYTIRDIAPHYPWNDGLSPVAVLLVEIINQPRLYRTSPTVSMTEELRFSVSRFRPLVSTKTDISLFQKILEEAGKEAKEKV